MEFTMYTPAQIALAKQHNMPVENLLKTVYHWDGTRPTLEEVLSGRPATAPSETPEDQDLALAPLLCIEIPGTESTVGDFLEIDSPTTRAILARYEIHQEAGALHLSLSQNLLLRLLISPLLREHGARLSAKTGTLSIPFRIA